MHDPYNGFCAIGIFIAMSTLLLIIGVIDSLFVKVVSKNTLIIFSTNRYVS